MLYQVIIETDSDLFVLDVDGEGDYIIGNGVVGELASMQAEWPEHTCPDGGTMMPGTRVYNGRKINHVILNIDSEDPLTLLEALLVGYGLNWEVRAMAPLRDSDGFGTDEETGEPVEIPFDLQPAVALEPWLADVGEGERPTLPALLHSFAGQLQLTVPTA